MFEPKTFAEVFEGMRQRSAAITDFEVGSVTRTMYESFAYEIALLYEKMHLTYLSAFVDTAQGAQLDLVVSVLGIRRGLPDFAEGIVTFTRDLGQDDTLIPLATLVTTEEPKRAYRTVAAATLAAGSTTVEVEVQAIERGEEQVTAAATITVMPRPVPGIKSVSNRDATAFHGKRRETDKELRERAKNALISSGKATVVAIENALLRLPGVRDVKVNERYRFVRGEVTLTRAGATGELVVPRGTTLVAGGKAYATRRRRLLAAGETSAVVEVQAAVEGRAGELEAGAVWQVEDADLELRALTAASSEPFALGDFGIIEVLVDTDEDPESFRPAVDRVRAAGIFVLLEATRRVELDVVLQVEINPELRLSDDDRAELETAVRRAVEEHLATLKMGQPLVFSQLIKTVLDLDGIVHLELAIDALRQGDEIPQSFKLDDQRIAVDELERCAARHVCVASEVKPLPVHVRFQASGLDPGTNAEITAAVSAYFAGLEAGATVVASRVESAIGEVGGVTLAAGTLELSPAPWCERPPDAGDDVAARFVEQAVLGDVFAYSGDLEITGALALTLPVSLTEAEKAEVYAAVRAAVDAHHERLPAEADILFAELAAAATVDRVLAVDVDPDDFRVTFGGVEPAGRISKEKIEVEAFERPRCAHLCVTGGIETVAVAATKLELELLPPPDLASVEAGIKAEVITAFNNSLTAAEPGRDVPYAKLENALLNLMRGVDYRVKELELTATSAGDGRTQTTAVATARDLHIRSVEVATLVAITEADITLTEKTT